MTKHDTLPAIDEIEVPSVYGIGSDIRFGSNVRKFRGQTLGAVVYHLTLLVKNDEIWKGLWCRPDIPVPGMLSN